MVGADQINIIWGISLSIIPYFILAFIPVWDQLRFSRKTVLFLGFFCITLNILSVLLIMEFFPNWTNLRFFHSLFFCYYISEFIFFWFVGPDQNFFLLPF